MTTAGRSTARSTRATPETVRPRPTSNDLGLELYRQQTLLAILSARMRESAARLERGAVLDPARVRRGVDAHRRYLREVHDANVERLARTVARSDSDAAAPVLERLAGARPRAEAFERDVEAILGRGVAPGSEGAHRLARLFAQEADRIDQEATWETENLHARLDAWLTPTAQSRLLAEIRRFDAARVDAEIALVSWASQLHPSAD